MKSPLVWIIIFVVGLSLSFEFWRMGWRKKSKKKLSKAVYSKAIKGLKALEKKSDYEKIVQGHAIFIGAVKTLAPKNQTGKTAAEVMNSLKNRLKNKEKYWQAHNLRNRVVHEPDFRLKKGQGTGVLQCFKAILEEL